MRATILLLTPHDPFGYPDGTNRDLWAMIDVLRERYTLILGICRLNSPHRPYSDVQVQIEYVPRQHRWRLREEEAAFEVMQTLLKTHQPELVFCYYSDLVCLVHSAGYEGTIFLRAIDADFLHAYEKYRSQMTIKQLKLLFYLMRKLVSIAIKECLAYRRAAHIFHIGYADQHATRYCGGQAAREWLPPLISLPIPSSQPSSEMLHVIFVGGMSAFNKQGVVTLVEAIIPAIHGAYPDRFYFHIVGAVGEYVEQIPTHTTVHGYVENIDELMQKMHIACVPIEGGWGSKLKVIDALAYGLAVVGAPSAFRGVPPGDTHIVCHSISDYVQAFGELYDPVRRVNLGQQGRQALYDWVGEGQTRLLATVERYIKRAGP